MSAGAPKLMDHLADALHYIKHSPAYLDIEDDRRSDVRMQYLTMNSPVAPGSFDEMRRKSEILRNIGNKFFKDESYHTACLNYTKSITYAQDDECAALGYANRSAALFNLCRYEECLGDIKVAFSKGYPANLKHKLYIRQARCYKLLNEPFSDSLEAALKAVEAAYTGDEMLKLLDKMQLELTQPAPEPKMDFPEPFDWTLPELSYGQSEEVLCFSSAVKVAYNRSLGRHLIADRDIEIGDVLIVEKSICTVLAPDENWIYCNTCIKICFSLIPCPKCKFVMYCSDECKQADWVEGHKEVCQRYDHLRIYTKDFPKKSPVEGRISREMVLFLLLHMLVAKLGRENLKKFAKDNPTLTSFANEPRTRGFDKTGKFTFSLEALMSLTDNLDKHSSDDIEEAISSSLRTLMQFGFMNASEKKLVAALCLKLISVVKFNSKLINVCKSDYSKFESSSYDMGLSLFLASSLMNHSCDPNMYMICYGPYVVYRALRPIKKDEQLTEGDQYTLLMNDFDTRKMIFAELWKFTCKCDACKNRWPTLGEMPENAKFFTSNLGQDKSAMAEYEKMKCYFKAALPADVHILPTMIKQLKKLHDSKDKVNQVYFTLQENIKNHYRAQGNSLLTKRSREVLNGTREFDKKLFLKSFAETKANPHFMKTVF